MTTAHYEVSGLRLTCNHLLPCLISSNGAVDIVVHYFASTMLLAALPVTAVRNSATAEMSWHDEQNALHIRFTDPLNSAQLEFILSATNDRVDVYYSAGIIVDDITRVLLGTIMGRILSRRGKPALHANVVDIDGGAVLFCGCSGAGKSSTTAALVAAGAPLLADDIATLEMIGQQLFVAHGYPHLRLWPDSAQSLGSQWQDLPLVFSRTETMGFKCYRDLSQTPELFTGRPLPLRVIYLLKARVSGQVDPSFRSLSQQEAVPALLGNLYLGQEQAAALVARQLPAMVRVAQQCLVYEVSAPDGLNHLPAFAEALVTHARQSIRQLQVS